MDLTRFGWHLRRLDTQALNTSPKRGNSKKISPSQEERVVFFVRLVTWHTIGHLPSGNSLFSVAWLSPSAARLFSLLPSNIPIQKGDKNENPSIITRTDLIFGCSRLTNRLAGM